MQAARDNGGRRREVLARLFTSDGTPRAGLENVSPLNSADVAALFRMTERAIRMQAAKGELPHMRTLGGGRLLYPADEIAAMYVQHCSKFGLSRTSGRAGAARSLGRRT